MPFPSAVAVMQVEMETGRRGLAIKYGWGQNTQGWKYLGVIGTEVIIAALTGR